MGRISYSEPAVQDIFQGNTFDLVGIPDTDVRKLKTITLCKNLIKSIGAQADMPAWELYPKAHRVTYMYYNGVIAFLQEDYSRVCLDTKRVIQPLTSSRQKFAW